MSSNYSFLQDKEEEKSIAIDYDALVDLSKKNFSETLEEGEKDSVAFYCRDCKKIVDVERIQPKKKRKKKIGIQFSCKECEGGNIYFGTNRGVSKHFHLSKT